nr:hypothetical protein [Tanacetum cinerariifolium]
MPPKSVPLTQAAVRRIIKESVNATIAVVWARHANARNDLRGSRPVRGQYAAPVVLPQMWKGWAQIKVLQRKECSTSANAQPVWTCYDYGKQGHTRNRCPKKVKQEETREVCSRAYAIKDAEPQGSDRSFVDTKFSSMLNIDSVKINTSYEVK